MRQLVVLGIFVVMVCSCKKSQEPVPKVIPPEVEIDKGADVGWLTEMEAAGVRFYNSSGEEQECMAILKGKGINSIRLRAWVNPEDGWNGTRDLVVKAKRAKDLGMKLMIDFHYSDSWADPGQQTKPAAWASMSFDNMKTALYDYTLHVMDTLKGVGIDPEWVQIGNETNDGMLWPEGKASTAGTGMANFTALVNSGYDAVKAAGVTSKVIVHLSNGYDNSLFRWMFDGLTSNNAKYDIIGMSLYPQYSGVEWQAANIKTLTNMKDMVSRYGKPVMIVEVGMPASDAANAKLFLKDIIAKTKTVPNEMGLGVFYWEPECYNNWHGYSLGAFDNSGKPTVAMDAFSD